LLAQPVSAENTVQKASARTVLTGLLNRLARYVQSTADGDEVKLLSSGFTLARAWQRFGILPAPENFNILPVYAGAINVSVKKTKGAKVYNFQYTPMPLTANSIWGSVTSTKIKATISNLESGKQYAFRVAAVGSVTNILYSHIIYSYVL
jgi:hypothetical protein